MNIYINKINIRETCHNKPYTALCLYNAVKERDRSYGSKLNFSHKKISSLHSNYIYQTLLIGKKQ